MKFFIPLVAAFAALTAAAPTSPDAEVAMVKRETVTIQDFMSELTSQVKTHTDAINKITASVPHKASLIEKRKYAAEAIPQIKAIEDIIKLANTRIADAPKQVSTRATKKPKQPTLGDLPADVLSQLNGQPIVLARLLLPLLQELNPAVGSVLATLYLEEVYVALQPLLTVELPALVSGLSVLVSGLLAALAPLLVGLGGILGPLLLGLGL